MGLTNKQRVFIEEYLQCWNATEAARRAGYSEKTARQQGSRLLTNVDISAEIKARIDDLAMSADEVIIRLGDMGRADIGDFMDTTTMTFDIAMQRAKEANKTKLIKKIKQKTIYTKDEEEIHQLEIELHDSQAALVHLGRYHGLFSDKVINDSHIDITVRYVDKAD